MGALLLLWGVAETAVSQRYRRTLRLATHTTGRFCLWHGLAIFATTIVILLTGIERDLPGLTRLGPAIGLFTSGLLLRLWSIATLKEFFRDEISLSANHQIIRNGPYRFLKHPAELGLLMSLSGLSLVGSGMGFLFIAIFVLPLSLLRMHYENRMILEFLNANGSTGN